MEQYAIKVEGLGKRFYIGAFQQRYNRTLAEGFTDVLRGPWLRIRSLMTTRLPTSADQELWALRDISFQVAPGEVLGVIGPNGSGKSTLLKILSHITEPTEGIARLRGQVSSLLEVGTGFHGELTGRENIYLNGAILGMRQGEINRKFDEIVEFSGVGKFLDTPVKRYSTGMKVRLAFAVAAHLEPEILLVDEVLSVGDASFQRKSLDKMRSVTQQGRTVLFVSHHMESILGLCSKVIWLEQGHIRMEGPTEQVVRDYLANSLLGSQSREQAPLRERVDREGNGQFRFTDLRIQNETGETILTVMSGDTLNFVLSYEGEPDSLQNVSIRIWFIDDTGRELLYFWTGYTGDDFDVLPPTGEIICQARRFPLAPGRYAVALRATVNAQRADFIRNATVLEVTGSNYFKTGVKAAAHAPFLADHSWQLTPKVNVTETSHLSDGND